MVKEKELTKYWVIKIGNLFYVSGLPRMREDNKDTKGYDFSNNESVAFPILIEDVAKDMAKEMGGIVIEKFVCDVEELMQIKNKVYCYINSSKLIEKQNCDIFRDLQIMESEKIRVKMLTTVLPDIGFFANDDLNTIARINYEYNAVSNEYGAIAVVCDNGKQLGVKPGEFEFIEAPEWVLNIHNAKEKKHSKKYDSSYKDEKRKHLYELRASFLCYCHSFQKYDMYLEKSLEEIKKIVNEIPDNFRLTKNGEIFKGTYDYLCKDVSLNTLRDTIKFLENKKQITKLSLNEFINYCTNNSYYD